MWPSAQSISMTRAPRGARISTGFVASLTLPDLPMRPGPWTSVQARKRWRDWRRAGQAPREFGCVLYPAMADLGTPSSLAPWPIDAEHPHRARASPRHTHDKRFRRDPHQMKRNAPLAGSFRKGHNGRASEQIRARRVHGCGGTGALPRLAHSRLATLGNGRRHRTRQAPARGRVLARGSRPMLHRPPRSLPDYEEC